MANTFKADGKTYEYKFLGDGPWTPECASLELMRILRNYFKSAGMMKQGGHWPDSNYRYAWTSDVGSHGSHVELYSNGGAYNGGSDGYDNARYSVVCLDE